jgi:hypothetical protein
MRTGIPQLLVLATAGCGRSWIYELPQPTPAPTSCSLAQKPTALNFGEVPLNESVTMRLLLSNVGTAPCQLTEAALGDPSDADFSLPVGQPTSLTIAPGSAASLSVDFEAASPTPPTVHQSTLTFASSDPTQPEVSVPVSADVVTICEVSVAPTPLDFGHIPIGTSVTLQTRLTNTGSAPCSISMIGIAAGSDLEFSVPPDQPQPLTLPLGGSAPVSVTFDATDRSKPHLKSGTLVLQTNDPQNFSTSVPLSATIDIGCDLSFSPGQLDFGGLTLNTTSTLQISLSNDGSAVCNVTGVALGTGTDPLFSLPSQPSALQVTPGGTGTVSVEFSASDSAPPHQRSGTLLFQTGNSASPSASVPLSAVINTPCSEASQFIYTVDGTTAVFSQFDPTKLTFTDIAVLTCPTSSPADVPFDMAVDQNAVAWVLYESGELFQVDTTTAACQSTNWIVGQKGYTQFGMGFVFSPTTNLDTLYISGALSQPMPGTQPPPEPLATVAFPSLTATTIGTVSIGFADLTGTGNGQLWAFAPPYDSVTNTPVFVQLDPDTGATLSSFTLPSLQNAFDADWAMKFWGGSFWIFIGNSVYAVDSTTQVLTEPLVSNGPRNIVGAGVSTCAPVQ